MTYPFGCCIVSAARRNSRKPVCTPRQAPHINFTVLTRSINCFVIMRRLASKPNGLRWSIESRVMNALEVSWVLGRSRQPVVSDPFLSSNDVTPAVQCVTIYGAQKTAFGINEVVIPHDSGAFLWRQNKTGGSTIDAQIDLFRSFNFLK